MNRILDDDVLTQLLGEAADSFQVPEEGPSFVLEELAIGQPRVRSRRLAKWGAVAAAVVVGILVVQAATGTAHVSTRARSTAAAGLAPNSASKDAASSPALASAPVPRAAAGTTSNAQKALDSVEAPVDATVAAPDGFSDGAKIVKTGTIALIVKDRQVSPVVTDITRKLTGLGGYVADSKTQEYGDAPSSTITIRMPVARFEEVITLVRGEGKVESSSTSGQDVTAQYADVDAQIRSLTAARERFLVILGRANTIGETLSVQQRIDAVQQQIDQLTGRLRVLKDQTSMGTLTVTVSEKAKAVGTHEQSGLSRSWDNAKHGFTSGVESLISKSGRGLLVLLVAVVCLVLLRTGWRLARRRLV